MKKEIYEISSRYMRDLKKLLNSKQITPYDIAHASFRKNNAHWIIKSIDKTDLTITYLNGDVRQFATYNELMKRMKMTNEDYKPARKKHIKKYYEVINAYTKHRQEMKRSKKNTIANALDPEHLRMLAQQI
tara:strand:+ start:835 stop:1227 length:393 start_codon:yes stop_codon:yes gene_type:complete